MRVTTVDDLMAMLDGLYGDGKESTGSDGAAVWDGLFRQEDHPLTSDLPDASLVAWHADGLLGDQPGRTALDVGCGLGRNSRWLAANGFITTGIDVAPLTLRRAARRSEDPGVTYLQRDFVRADATGVPFDLIYDSGCYHHLAPHRRISYMHALEAALVPGGLFGICTFAAGQMGSTSTDADLLRDGALNGGLGYTLNELREMFSWLEAIDVGPMPSAESVPEPVFTQEFLNVALFRRPMRG
jgi:SAM-dependent methyltransferase